jgi:putative transposase
LPDAALANGRLRLPKIGDVKVLWSRPLPAVPTSVAVIRDAAGRFFASFVVEVTPRPLPETEAECGIDLGLGHFVVLDDGTKVAAPKFLRRAEKRLRKAHKALSRKQRGSKRSEKARVKVARAHAKIADARRDFHHKISTKVVRENQAITVEDLSVQVCSSCGMKDGPKPLHIREWQCKECGTFHDRDVNAAKNIAALGRREALNASGGQVRPAATLASAGEAGSRRGAA